MPTPSRITIATAMAVLLSFVVCVFFVASSLFSVEAQQTPIFHGNHGKGKVDLIYELKKAEIIPTVIDEFAPLLSVSVNWKGLMANYGNTVKVPKTKKEPKIKLIDEFPGGAWSTDRKIPQLTLAMTDPDAPSRDNPEWSEICHWITTDIDLSKPSEKDDGKHGHSISKRQLDIMPYKPPGPPAKTGKHRYVFVALAPKNGTTETLHLRKPDDRQHWGFEHERDGLRMWAEEMGLKVVGANFIYEQNEEQ